MVTSQQVIKMRKRQCGAPYRRPNELMSRRNARGNFKFRPGPWRLSVHTSVNRRHVLLVPFFFLLLRATGKRAAAAAVGGADEPQSRAGASWRAAGTWPGPLAWASGGRVQVVHRLTQMRALRKLLAPWPALSCGWARRKTNFGGFSDAARVPSSDF